MALNFQRFYNGITIQPQNTTTPSIKGDLRYNSATDKLELFNGIVDPIVTEADTATLTNKTLTGNTATSFVNGSGTFNINSTGTVTVPNTTDTLVGKNTTDTLTNKTIAAGSNTITGLTNTNLSGSAAITNANLASMAANTAKANITGSPATPSDVSAVSTPTASSFMVRDANANVSINNITQNYTTTATAAGTTNLSVSSSYFQYFTGSTTQTVKLPDATTLPQTGYQIRIVNLSSGNVTVQDNGSNPQQVMAANTVANFTAKSVATANGSWDVIYTSTSVTASGSNTGDVTLAAVGSSPNANAASLSGQVLNLQPFNSSFPGVVSASGGGTSNFLRADNTWAVPTATAAFNVTSQTTTYSAAINDYIVASGSSFAITLPTAVGQSGKQIVIQHNGTSLSQKYTLNTTSSQTINGPGGTVASGVYKLTTNGEKLVLTSDGSNWQVTEHDTNTGWVSAGNAVYYETFTVSSANATIGATYTNNGATFTVAKTIAAGTTLITQFFSGGPLTSGTLTKATGTGDATITFSAVSGNISPITGTTTNPVYYGSPVTNNFAWKRVGNMITLLVQFYQDTAGAVGGSGDFIYDFSIPIPNVQIDTTYFPTFTGGTANTFQGETPATMINMQPFVNGSHSHSSAYSDINGFIPYSATQFRLYGSDIATTTNGFPWGSTIAPGNVIQSMNYYISFPVSDWQS